MKKRKLLRIAVTALLIGLAAACIGSYGMKGDLSLLDTREFATREVCPEGNFDAVNIKDSTANVIFRLSEDGVTRVELTEDKEHQHHVNVQDGTLYIEEDKGADSLFRISGIRKMSVTVYLPDKAYRDLAVTLSTGDFKMDAPLRFENVKAGASTGCIDLHADIGSVSATTTTGEIRMKEMKPESVVLNTSTGGIQLTDLHAGSRISCAASTGKAVLTNCIADEIRVSTSTGDISLTGCDAQTLKLAATTGDIRASLLSGKQFKTSSTTGKVQCPPNDGDGVCSAVTTTGNISITVSR